jgi:hypothetical protein
VPKKIPVVTSPIQAAEMLASGQVRFERNCDCDEFINKALLCGVRPNISEEHELFLWECFQELCKELAPNCRFNQDGICNNAEKRRRNALFGLLRLINFRSQDERIKRVFQANFGQVSLKWMMEVCTTEAPPFYYEWAFEAIREVSSKVWGSKTLGLLQKSWAHMEVFQRMAHEKSNLLAIKRIMES